jgi:hypothetical protein
MSTVPLLVLMVALRVDGPAVAMAMLLSRGSPMAVAGPTAPTRAAAAPPGAASLDGAALGPAAVPTARGAP